MSRRHFAADAPVVAIVAAVVIALCAITAPPAHATLIIVPNAVTPITVPNGSFELPNLADNAFTFGPGGFSDGTATPDWSFSGYQSVNGIVDAGIWDPGSTDYTIAGGNNTPLPPTAAGGQAAYIYLDQDTNPVPQLLSGELTSPVLTTIQSDTNYKLTVALGRAKNVNAGDVVLELETQDFPLASIEIPGSAIPQDGFADFAVELPTFIDYPFEGLELSARITHSYSGLGAVSLDIDNVRFESSPLPEPGSAMVALLAIGAVVPMSRRRRRRPLF